MRSFLGRPDAGTRERVLLAAEAALRVDPDASLADVARAAGLRRRAVRAEFATIDQVVAALALATTSRLCADLMEYASTGEAPDLVWTRFLDDLWMTLPSFDYLLPFGRAQRYPLATELLTPLLWRKTAVLSSGRSAGMFAFEGELEPASEHTQEALLDALLEEAEYRAPTSRRFITSNLQLLGVAPGRVAELLEALLVVRPGDTVLAAVPVAAS